MKTQKTILVTGATGKQGGAVARHLLKAGFKVRALTRNPGSGKAQQLEQLGATLVEADLNEADTLNRALEGCYGVFSVQNYWEKDAGYEGELHQGKTLADAAKAASIQHFVQSTMAKAENFDGVEHFASKERVENYIKTINLPFTLIGTVYFMDNLLDPGMGGAMTFPVLSGSLHKDTVFQLLAVDDIGAVVAEVFKQPELFMNRRIDLAGDQLTVKEMKHIYKQVSGRHANPLRIPAWMMRFLNHEFAAQLRWHNRVGWEFGADQAREVYPAMTTFKSFLQKHEPGGL